MFKYTIVDLGEARPEDTGCDGYCYVRDAESKIDGTMKSEPERVVVEFAEGLTTETVVLTKDDMEFFPGDKGGPPVVSVKTIVALLDIHEHCWGGE